MISCWNRMVACLSLGRTPQPLRISGLTMVAEPILPKLMLLPVTAAQVSPLRELAAGFVRSQSTILFPLSVQPRLVTTDTIVAAGFDDVYGASLAAYARYLPQLNFTAVLPLPKTSYATPTRGVMSL